MKLVSPAGLFTTLVFCLHSSGDLFRISTELGDEFSTLCDRDLWRRCQISEYRAVGSSQRFHDYTSFVSIVVWFIGVKAWQVYEYKYVICLHGWSDLASGPQPWTL